MSKELTQRCDDNIGTVNVTIRVPLYIDQILRKPLEEISEKEWKEWERFVSKEYKMWDSPPFPEFYLEQQSIKDIQSYMSKEHFGWIIKNLIEVK